MSLIVCRKEDDYLLLVSDTKLSSEGEIQKKQTGNPLDGTIKSVIINPKLCISFAGEIVPAEDALKEIKNGDSIDVLSTLRNHSVSGKTEFLVCAADPLKIYKVSKGECTEEENAWIGSAEGFSKFQGYFLGKLTSPDSGYSKVSITPTFTKKGSNLSNVTNAFDSVIFDSAIDEVDGFKVMVHYLSGSFQYKGYIKSYLGPVIIDGRFIKPGTKIPLDLGGSHNGSYNINFFNSNDVYSAVAVHVREGEFGIVYTREGYGLLKPEIVKMDEVDFVDYTKDKYGIGPGMISQSKEWKFFELGNARFKERDYKNAIFEYDKVIVENSTLTGHAFFRRGLAFLNLRDIINGYDSLNKSRKADSSLYRLVEEQIQKLSRRGV